MKRSGEVVIGLTVKRAAVSKRLPRAQKLALWTARERSAIDGTVGSTFIAGIGKISSIAVIKLG